jgi:guanine deaminase
LLYLATLGGAQVCCLADHTGNFVAGKSFDALLVNVRQGHGNPGLWGVGEADKKEKPEALLERFLFCGDDRNIKRVYVRGRMIGGTDHGKKAYEH